MSSPIEKRPCGIIRLITLVSNSFGAYPATPLHIMNVSVGVVGPGLIGGALLGQLAKQAANLLGPLHASAIRVVGIANSKRMLLEHSGVDLTAWKDQLGGDKAQPLDLHGFAKGIVASGAAAAAAGVPSCCVLVDCSASDAVPDAYLDFMGSGLHIITPNKKFGAGPLARYLELRQRASSTGRRFMYEATVGAGLPVMSTLQGLLETGDKVLRVQGILSGTLSYIFNTYKAGMRFSDVVADARAKGYTEPDPREDLSGTDVARKVVILARECGLAVGLDSMAVESLVPQPLAGPDVSPDMFMERLPQYDEAMAAKARDAESAGQVVRYVGSVDMEAATASVTLATYPGDHPFAQLSGSDNIVVFTTERYRDRPLVVRGPGAGAEVTAAGVFSDLIQVIRTHRG